MCQRSPARVVRARSLRPRGCGGGSVPVAAPPLRSPPGPAGSSLLPHGILTPARAGAPPLPLASSPPAAAAAAASLGGAGAAPPSRAPAAGEAGGAGAIAQRPLPIPPAAARRHRHCPCCPVLSLPPFPSRCPGHVSHFPPLSPSQNRQVPQPPITAGAVKRGAGGATAARSSERRWRRGSRSRCCSCAWVSGARDGRSRAAPALRPLCAPAPALRPPLLGLGHQRGGAGAR